MQWLIVPDEYASFREWNPDPEIADCAEKLYGDINNLELYVGLQVSLYTSLQRVSS